MQRYFLKVEYDGTNFCGWQKQNGKRSVQGEIENSLFKLFGENISVFGSGRTDSGVHALDQAVHFDLKSIVPPDRLKLALNDILPRDISVKKAKYVRPDLNVRKDIKKKTYLYKLKCDVEKDAINGSKITQIKYELDFDKMLSASKIFMGKHNFKGYTSAKAQVSDFNREIYDVNLAKRGKMILFRITGNGFMYNMVRIIVGSLVEVGQGKKTKDDLIKALESGDRSFAGKTMPPEGLYLEKTYF